MVLEHPPVDFLGMRGRLHQLQNWSYPTGIGKEDRESQSKSSSTQIGMGIGYTSHDWWDRTLGVLNGINIGLPCGSGPIVPCDNAVREVFPQQRLHQVAGNVGKRWKKSFKEGWSKNPLRGIGQRRFRQLRFTSSEIRATDRIHCASCTFRLCFCFHFWHLAHTQAKVSHKNSPGTNCHVKILQIGLPDGQGPDMGRTKVDCLGLPWPCFIFFPLIGSMLLNIGLFEDHPIHIWLHNLCQILSRKLNRRLNKKKSRPKGFHRGSPFQSVSQLSEEEAEILGAEEDLLLTI